MPLYEWSTIHDLAFTENMLSIGQLLGETLDDGNTHSYTLHIQMIEDNIYDTSICNSRDTVQTIIGMHPTSTDSRCRNLILVLMMICIVATYNGYIVYMLHR